MKYIIMCGGKYCKWDEPRQFTRINGEPIIARTIRLLRDEGVEDIAISTNDKRFDAFGVPLLEHANSFDVREDGAHGCWVDAFYPMDDPACYIFGDVVFSPDAIRTIVERKTSGIMFFASKPPYFHPGYTKQWAEPFAFKVEDQARFREAIEYVRVHVNAGIFLRHPIAWELWQVINHEDPKRINFENYTAINDYTCDVDRPGDAEAIEKAINAWG